MAVALPLESVCKRGGVSNKCISFLSVYSIEKQLEQYMGCEKRGERSAEDTEGPAVLDSSCSGKTADPPLATRTLTGAGAILHRTGCDEDKSLACRRMITP